MRRTFLVSSICLLAALETNRRFCQESDLSDSVQGALLHIEAFDRIQQVEQTKGTEYVI